MATPPEPPPPAAFKEQGTLPVTVTVTVIVPVPVPVPAPEVSAVPGWADFHDPDLTDLIDRAMVANADLHAAVARLNEARALLQAREAAAAPQLGLRASASRQGGPLVNAAGSNGSLFDGRAELRVETDLQGRRPARRAADAAEADARAADLAELQTLLQADVARHLLSLRGVDAELATLQAGAELEQRALAIVQQRHALGTVGEAELLRQRRQAADAEADAAALRRQRALLEHALAVLCGQAASTFNLPPAPAARLDDLPPVPAALPGSVLARRPDLAAARQRVQAAAWRAGLAQAPWFPDIVLGASAGHASARLADLLSAPARTWALGVQGVVAVFDGRRRDAEREAASAALDAAAADYRQRVLTAFRQVEDQLATLRTLAEQGRARDSDLAQARRLAASARNRQRSGLVGELQALEAEQQANQAERVALRVRVDRATATVALLQALGYPLQPGETRAGSAETRAAAAP